ncbi:MarR family transcriptional regulator [Halobacillus salinarum]|uniref:MarR family transcriptional regulator n=1 Tax=Halobacillus salinarum TaxID=2932257 RepID=A0ABY4EEK5_9BACI|nr:MarR family transcriptional regulator [Halobacillus salinarum]
MSLSFQDYISIKIHQTDLRLTSFIKTKLVDYNLAPEQNLIMMLLWETNGLTQNQLAHKLNKDKTNVARMAVSLEKKGFIDRIPSSDDKRSLQLSLTAEGRKLKHQILPEAEDFNAKVCSDFSKEELDELNRLLTKINRNIEKFDG